MRRGTRVGQAYVAVTADGSGINEEIVDSVDEAGDGVEKSGDEHGKRYGNRFGEGFRDRLDSMRSRLAKGLSDRLGESGDDAGHSFVDRMEDVLDRSGDRMGETLGERIGEAVADRLELALANVLGDFENSDLFANLTSGNGRGGGGVSGNGGKSLGDRIGGVFGAGSRNNFLNVFGSSLGNIINLTEFARKGATSLFSTFTKGFSEAEEGASFFQKTLKGFSAAGAGGGTAIAEGLSSMAASGPAAAAAILVVVGALSVFVSVSGALLALLTALVATITSALTGAVLVLGAALGAAAAAAGLLVIAFTSMTDAQSALLSEAFQPLHAVLTGIGQLMITQMIPYFQTWSTNLQEALSLAGPLAAVMGQAFGQAGATLTAALSGPGFQRLMTVLGQELPTIVLNLSSALGSLLSGMAGLFAALLPYVTQFSGYLADVAARFSDWANSAQGQNAIVDFVERALGSLQSLWNFVREFSGFVVDVLFNPSAQQQGNSMFDTLANAFEGFRRKIADGSLEKWFTKAATLGAILWEVFKALGGTIAALYNSGVIDGVVLGLSWMTSVIQALNVLLGPLVDLIGTDLRWAADAAQDPLRTLTNTAIGLANALGSVLNLISKIPGAPDVIGNAGDYLSGLQGSAAPQQVLSSGPPLQLKPTKPSLPNIDLSSLIASGNSALHATSVDNGGYKPAPVKPEYVNPYKAYAASLIKDGPSVSAQIKNAMLTINKQVAKTIRDATTAANAGDVKSAIADQVSSIRTSVEQSVNSAQSALNSAAQSLYSASSKGAAEKALAAVKRAQRDLDAALKNQERIQKIAKRLNAQKIVSSANVTALLNGEKVKNATLADYARARERVANQIDKANKKLADAIKLRDDYKASVTDGVNTFGSIITAQAKVINGVEQALTFRDITSNLEDRLAKIRKFQSDLQILLAQGLSNDAYKQLVDAGVENGSAYAAALVQGGSGAVSQVNSLVDQISASADALGSQASDRLYQAGVNAAQGLLDGLNSLASQLDSAAARLGNAIAAAVKKSLGIHSPSTVMAGMMDYVGDGAVIGLDNQAVKVGRAAQRFSDNIAVSPEVAAYAARQGQSATVSGNGNDPRFRDLIVNTPTENPEAVAMEVLNEVTGRL